MERIHKDILGTLKESVKGNTSILVVIDRFTKWVEFMLYLTKNAQTVATTLTDYLLSKFGCPANQGENLDGNIFSELCKLFEISKTRTIAYRLCCISQVERYNKKKISFNACVVLL